MTVQQIDRAISAEAGDTVTSRAYAWHLEWLRARTLEVEEMRNVGRGPRRARDRETSQEERAA